MLLKTKNAFVCGACRALLVEHTAVKYKSIRIIINGRKDKWLAQQRQKSTGQVYLYPTAVEYTSNYIISWLLD